MIEHPFLFEIVQKVWTAARDWGEQEVLAYINGTPYPPPAYPVITPLIEELVKYCDELIRKPECLFVFNDMSGLWDRARAEDLKHIEARYAIFDGFHLYSLPSSPFRSVEIVDGELK